MHNVKARFLLATMRYDSTRLEDSNLGNLGEMGEVRVFVIGVVEV